MIYVHLLSRNHRYLHTKRMIRVFTDQLIKAAHKFGSAACERQLIRRFFSAKQSSSKENDNEYIGEMVLISLDLQHDYGWRI